MKKTFVALFTIALASPFLLAQPPTEGAVELEKIDIAAPTDAPLDAGLTIDAGITPAQPTEALPPSPGPAVVLPSSAESLPPEQQEKLQSLLNEASTFVQGIRVQEALERIFEAQRMAPDFPVVYNLEGAAWTKAKEFDKAKIAFQKCLALDPGSPEAQFNLAELEFISDHFEEARASFDKILADEPRFPANTRNLIRFKSFLCSLMLGDENRTAEMLASFEYMSDTPEHYYANAAVAFKAGDKDEAHSWLRSASRIYSRPLQDLFVDSLVELGWVETL